MSCPSFAGVMTPSWRRGLARDCGVPRLPLRKAGTDVLRPTIRGFCRRGMSPISMADRAEHRRGTARRHRGDGPAATIRRPRVRCGCSRSRRSCAGRGPPRRRAPEAVGRREDTVEPPPRVEEHEDTIIEGLAAASPTEEAPSEEVFLSPASGRRDPRSVSGADLIVEQPEEGVERGVEGGDPRAVDPFAVPATVILLVFEEPVDEPIDVRIEPESV